MCIKMSACPKSLGLRLEWSMLSGLSGSMPQKKLLELFLGMLELIILDRAAHCLVPVELLDDSRYSSLKFIFIEWFQQIITDLVRQRASCVLKFSIGR